MTQKPFLGILMLDTRFPRPLGDAGNVESYHRLAEIHVVEHAGSLDIVRDGLPAPELIAAFSNAAKSLESRGAGAILSTCGFLITVQCQIARAVSVPVCLSALSLFPVVRATHGNRPIGILTASKPSLGRAALEAAGIGQGHARVAGMEGCPAFARAILRPTDQQSLTLDQSAVAAAAVAQAMALIEASPDIAAILLECGNLPPYAAAIRQATGRPVYSILDAARLILP